MGPEGDQREQVQQRRGGAQNGEVGPLAHAALQAAELTETRIATAEGRADRAEQAIVGERARADAVRARLDAMQEQLAAEVEAVEQARRQAQTAQDNAAGVLARLRAAWRGD
jgi:uncharacterized protein YPO0396